jgi:hypothetical protein
MSDHIRALMLRLNMATESCVASQIRFRIDQQICLWVYDRVDVEYESDL